MSTTKPPIPTSLPEETEEVLSRLFRAIGADYSTDKGRIAARFAAGLLLPRFAGTMLKFLCDKPFEAENLCRLAAEFQGKDPDDARIRFRLTIALEYLHRTECVRSLNGKVEVTDFGRHVYQERFPQAH